MLFSDILLEVHYLVILREQHLVRMFSYHKQEIEILHTIEVIMQVQDI